MYLGYDVIGAAINTPRPDEWSKYNKIIIKNGIDGNCYDRVKADRIPLPYFGDDCHLADIIPNFFIARTETAGSVRMDPQFKQKAHREWFIDSIGKLRIGR